MLAGMVTNWEWTEYNKVMKFTQKQVYYRIH